jgi:osmoprotectant transport system substrate-binding protein
MPRRVSFRRSILLVNLVVLSTGGACSMSAGEPVVNPSGAALHDDAVTIGTFDFDESVLLGELYAQALESEGVSVERRFDIGPREIVMPALELGILELVPEYTGAALEYLTGRSASGVEPAAAHERLREVAQQVDLETLTASPAEDRDAISVTRETANEYDLRRVSDLREVAPELLFGGPPECPLRPTCLPGLERVYGLRFERFVPLDVGGPVTISALTEGIVDVAQVFTTDADVILHDLVVLHDDRGLQPPQYIVPLVRAEVAERFGPGVARTLDAVSRRLTTQQVAVMVELIERGRSPASVAADWLREEGLSGDGSAA